MKIGVLTFHRCINYGSYWQARCLVEGLRDLGHDAVLLHHEAPEVDRAELRCAFQPRLPERSPRSDLPAYGRKVRRFLDAFDTLPESPRFSLHAPEQAGVYDLVVVGSDEVWNFRHPWYGGKPIFWGEGLRTSRLASYAASFGNHDAAEGVDAWWGDKLRRFTHLSVRDENSRRLVLDAIGIDPAMVLDPCLQFPPPDVEPVVRDAPYLALYGHQFPAWLAQRLRGWADARGVRIVSIGYRNDWADEQRIDAGPDGFSALIAGAEAVATNFFHGCVFALHHRRPFVAAPSAYRMNKIRDLVQSLAAERHMVDEGTSPERFAALLDAPLHPAIDARITAMRAQSSAYLATVLG